MLLGEKILRLYEFALETSPEEVSKSRSIVKREALMSFVRGLVSFPRERILAENVKFFEEAVNTISYLLDRDTLYRRFPRKPIE